MDSWYTYGRMEIAWLHVEYSRKNPKIRLVEQNTVDRRNVNIKKGYLTISELYAIKREMTNTLLSSRRADTTTKCITTATRIQQVHQDELLNKQGIETLPKDQNCKGNTCCYWRRIRCIWLSLKLEWHGSRYILYSSDCIET